MGRVPGVPVGWSPGWGGGWAGARFSGSDSLPGWRGWRWFKFWQGGKGGPTIKTCLVYGLCLLLVSSLFHFSYFIFSAPISFSLCVPISLSLLFLNFLIFFLKPLSSVVQVFVYIYINICIIYTFWKTYEFLPN